ncbi:MAG: MFS transporter [Desulfobacteraceae bacterium]|jgi:MFS family permease
MKPQEQSILITSCFGHFITHFNMLVFPAVVLPLTGHLGLDMAQVLGLSFWMYLLYGITALPWGILADRFGAKPFMLLFFLGAGLSGLFAAYWTDSPALFSVALAGVGLFTGIYHPVGLGMISKGVERMSMGLGYHGMFGNLGLATAPLLAGISNWLWGPRAVYLALGILNLMGMGLMWVLSLTEPKAEKEESVVEGDNGLLQAFIILLVAMMLAGIAYRGSSVVLPAYFELKNQGILQALSDLWGGDLSGNLVATTITSFIFLLGILGQYAGGVVAERYEPRYSYLTFHAVSMVAAFLMAMVHDLPLVVLALIYFFFLLGMQPIENTLVARFTPQRFHHSAYGTKFVLTFGVGALAVKMVGGIQDRWSIEATFIALGIVSLVLLAAVVLLILRTNAPKRNSLIVNLKGS